MLTAIGMSLMLCISVVASDFGGYLGDVPATEETVQVDGEKDAIYEYGLVAEAKFSLYGRLVKATAVATMLYTDGNLCVFIEVSDADVVAPDPAKQTTTPWETDSVEVFINDANSTAMEDIVQYRIDNSGWPCAYKNDGSLTAYGPDAASEYFEYAMKITDTGYHAEFCIPVSAAKVGVNIQVNDISSDGSEQTWAVLYSSLANGGAGSWEASQHPYITFGDFTVATPTGVVTESQAESVVPETTLPEDKTDSAEVTDEKDTSGSADTTGSDVKETQPQSPKDDEATPLSVGAVIGIVAAVIVVVLIGILILKRKQATK